MSVAHALTLLIALTACAPGGDVDTPSTSPTTTDDPTTEEPLVTARIELPAGVRSNLGIGFAGVEVRDLHNTLRIPGAFEVTPRARREFRMSLPGHVELHVDELDQVEAGQLLFSFRSPVWPELVHEILGAEQGVSAARAAIEVQQALGAEARRRHALLEERRAALAAADFTRADLTYEADTLQASLPRLEAELAARRTALESAESALDHAVHRAAQATGLTSQELLLEVAEEEGGVPAYLELEVIQVRASRAAVVESLAVTDGAFVEPSALVLTTLDPTRLRFRAQALQADLPRIHAASGARIVPPASPWLPADSSLPADLHIGLEGHPRERTFTLLASPSAQASWTLPGVTAFLEVPTESTARPVLCVPRAAVVRDGLAHVFFRRDPRDPDVVVRTEADLGLDDGRWVELRSGVTRDDEVVLEGVYELLLASQQAGGRQQQGTHVHADGSVHDDH